MAHLTDIPYLNGGNVLKYLEVFASYMKEEYPNLSYLKILIVGGSALALKYNFRSTVDIDADVQFGGKISTVIERVAADCNIPKDWLNQDFMKSYSYSRRIGEDASDVAILKGYVYVDVVSDKTQLCMKLTSGRPRDMRDIEYLTYKCYERGLSYENIMKHFNYLYGKEVRVKRDAERLCKSVFKRASKGYRYESK